MTSTTCSDITGCSAKAKHTATTATEPCKTVTAPVCSTFVTEQVDSSASTTTKITTSTCSDVTACSATPSTFATTTTSVSSPSPTLALYDIHAQPDVPWEVSNAFNKRLKNETKPESLYMCGSEEFQHVIYWRQYLTPEQVETYKLDPAVRTQYEKCNLANRV